MNNNEIFLKLKKKRYYYIICYKLSLELYREANSEMKNEKGSRTQRCAAGVRSFYMTRRMCLILILTYPCIREYNSSWLVPSFFSLGIIYIYFTAVSSLFYFLNIFIFIFSLSFRIVYGAKRLKTWHVFAASYIGSFKYCVKNFLRKQSKLLFFFQ